MGLRTKPGPMPLTGSKSLVSVASRVASGSVPLLFCSEAAVSVKDALPPSERWWARASSTVTPPARPGPARDEGQRGLLLQPLDDLPAAGVGGGREVDLHPLRPGGVRGGRPHHDEQGHGRPQRAGRAAPDRSGSHGGGAFP